MGETHNTASNPRSAHDQPCPAWSPFGDSCDYYAEHLGRHYHDRERIPERERLNALGGSIQWGPIRCGTRVRG